MEHHLVHDFRPRASRVMAAMSACALVPFAVWDIVGGVRWLGVALLALAAAFGYSARSADARFHTPTASVVLFVLPATAVIAWGIVAIDAFLTYWSFVAVMATYLVLPQRWAWGASSFMILVIAPVAGSQYGGWVGLRLAVCLLLIVVFAGVSVRLVDRLQRELVTLVITDPLTGLLNRSTLDTEMRRVMESGATAAMLAIDVDAFKSINDRYGHGAGDRVLAELAAVVRSSLRTGTPLFRLGGEEFMALVEDADIGAASAAAARVVADVAAHHFLDAHVVTVSIGVAELERDDTPDTWMRRADRALYEAKAAGRNTLVVG